MNFATSSAPIARATDPVTSHMAAARADYFKLSHANRIFRCLLLHPAGCTAKQIAEETGLTVVQVDRRLPELQREGRAQPVPMIVINGFRLWEALVHG